MQGSSATTCPTRRTTASSTAPDQLRPGIFPHAPPRFIQDSPAAQCSSSRMAASPAIPDHSDRSLSPTHGRGSHENLLQSDTPQVGPRPVQQSSTTSTGRFPLALPRGPHKNPRRPHARHIGPWPVQPPSTTLAGHFPPRTAAVHTRFPGCLALVESDGSQSSNPRPLQPIALTYARPRITRESPAIRCPTGRAVAGSTIFDHPDGAPPGIAVGYARSPGCPVLNESDGSQLNNPRPLQPIALTYARPRITRESPAIRCPSSPTAARSMTNDAAPSLRHQRRPVGHRARPSLTSLPRRGGA
jgi:hypothetical protein